MEAHLYAACFTNCTIDLTHGQEYQLTEYSLYAGASMGLRTSDMLSAMERFSKTVVPQKIKDMVSVDRYCRSSHADAVPIPLPAPTKPTIIPILHLWPPS